MSQQPGLAGRPDVGSLGHSMGEAAPRSPKPASTLIPVTFRVSLSAAGPSCHVSHLLPETDSFNISRWRGTGRDVGCLRGEARIVVRETSEMFQASRLIL